MTDKDDRKEAWFKFFPSDWQGDERLRGCSLAARGLWMEMICLMRKSTRPGYLLINGRSPTITQLALHVGVSVREAKGALEQLRLAGVYSKTEDDLVYSRRIVREVHRATVARANGINGGNPNWRRGTVPKNERVGPLSTAAKNRVFRRLWERCGGCCSLCGIALIVAGDGPGLVHVDHIIPRCDGGTHEESNLRLICRECNHKRKNVDETDETIIAEVIAAASDDPTEVADEPTQRTNPQIPEARSQTPQPPKGLLTSPDLADVAGQFMADYPGIYARCRNGAFFRVREARDWPTFLQLAGDYQPLSRLEEMLELFLKRSDIGEKNKPGTPNQFAHMAPDCDQLLRVNGR